MAQLRVPLQFHLLCFIPRIILILFLSQTHKTIHCQRYPALPCLWPFTSGIGATGAGAGTAGSIGGSGGGRMVTAGGVGGSGGSKRLGFGLGGMSLPL